MTEQEFSQFYKDNIDKVFRFIYLRVDKVETAQDLTSQVFLKIWQKASLRGASVSERRGDLFRDRHACVPQRTSACRHGLRPRDDSLKNPQAFIFKVARNQIIDFYRQKNKAPLSLEKLKESGFEISASGFSQKIELTLEMERIKKALQAISPVYADVIIWHYLDDLSNQEIAQILKKKEGNVRVLLHRALEALKKQLNS